MGRHCVVVAAWACALGCASVETSGFDVEVLPHGQWLRVLDESAQPVQHLFLVSSDPAFDCSSAGRRAAPSVDPRIDQSRIDALQQALKNASGEQARCEAYRDLQSAYLEMLEDPPPEYLELILGVFEDSNPTMIGPVLPPTGVRLERPDQSFGGGLFGSWLRSWNEPAYALDTLDCDGVDDGRPWEVSVPPTDQGNVVGVATFDQWRDGYRAEVSLGLQEATGRTVASIVGDLRFEPCDLELR